MYTFAIPKINTTNKSKTLLRMYFTLKRAPLMFTRPPDNDPKEAPSLFFGSLMCVTNSPSGVTSPIFDNRLSRGIRYSLNIIKLWSVFVFLIYKSICLQIEHTHYRCHSVQFSCPNRRPLCRRTALTSWYPLLAPKMRSARGAVRLRCTVERKL